MIEDDMSNYDEEGELCLKWLLKKIIILNTNYMCFSTKPVVKFCPFFTVLLMLKSRLMIAKNWIWK